MQTKGEYTPGPWHAHLHGRPELDNEEWLVLADDENVNEGDSLICSVNTLSGDDARLIAAAPVMRDYIERKAADGDKEAARILEAIDADS